MKVRALLFFAVAVTLIVLVQPFISFSGEILLYCTYAILIGIAFFVAIKPVLTYHIFSLIFEIPLGIIAFIEILFWLSLTIMICFTEIFIIMVGFVGIGFVLRGSLGAIIGFVATISVIWFFSNYLSKQANGRGSSMWQIAKTISSWWFPFPGRLMGAIWDIDKVVIAIFGEDIE